MSQPLERLGIESIWMLDSTTITKQLTLITRQHVPIAIVIPYDGSELRNLVKVKEQIEILIANKTGADGDDVPF